MSSWLGEPGPCPVDDTPHTGCTSADYVPSTAAIVIVQLPCRDALVAAEIAPVAPAPPSGTAFTTSTYRRELHGPRRRRP